MLKVEGWGLRVEGCVKVVELASTPVASAPAPSVIFRKNFLLLVDIFIVLWEKANLRFTSY